MLNGIKEPGGGRKDDEITSELSPNVCKYGLLIPIRRRVHNASVNSIFLVMNGNYVKNWQNENICNSLSVLRCVNYITIVILDFI